MASTTGHGHPPGYLAGCEACRRAARLYKRELRARKRGLAPVPDITEEAMSGAEESSREGAVVAAVRADLARLGEVSSQALAAVALVLACDLDNAGLGTSHAALARQLAAVLETLRKSAAPKRGRLAVVQQMTTDRHA